jgi:hypothetical protein
MIETTILQIQAPTLEQDYEKRAQDAICINDSQLKHPWWYNLKYTVVGLFFGLAFVKAEIISWFRIQEMFRFQSFHMYGVIGTGVLIGAISVGLIKKFKIRTIHGETVHFHPKAFNKGQIFGGLIFGTGWALTGACPGPIFTQIGTGAFPVLVIFASAVLGTWIYGAFREKLPH